MRFVRSFFTFLTIFSFCIPAYAGKGTLLESDFTEASRRSTGAHIERQMSEIPSLRDIAPGHGSPLKLDSGFGGVLCLFLFLTNVVVSAEGQSCCSGLRGVETPSLPSPEPVDPVFTSMNTTASCDPQKVCPPLMHIPERQQSFFHPGSITQRTFYGDPTSLSVFRSSLRRSLEESGELPLGLVEAEAEKMMKRHWQCLYKICEIDDLEVQHEWPFERQHYRKALRWMEEEFLLKPLTQLHSSEFAEFLKRLNSYMLKGHQFYQSSFRDKPFIVRTSPDIAFHRLEETRNFFNNKLKKLDESGLLATHAGHQFIDDRKRYSETCLDFMRTYPSGDINDRSLWLQYIGNILRDKGHFLHSFVADYYNLIPPVKIKKAKAKVSRILRALKVKLRKDDIIGAASYAHMELVKVPFFGHANGRTARAISDWILVQNGYYPAAHYQKKAYMRAVVDSIKAHNNKIYERYLREKICKTERLFSAEKAPLWTQLEESMKACKCEGYFTCDDSIQETCEPILRELGLLEE